MLKFEDISNISNQIVIRQIKLDNCHVRSAEFSMIITNTDDTITALDYKIMFTTNKLYRIQMHLRLGYGLIVINATSIDEDEQSINFIKKGIELAELITNECDINTIIGKYEKEYSGYKSTLTYNHISYRGGDDM